MESGINKSRGRLYASNKALLRAPLNAEQLDVAVLLVLEQLQHIIDTIPMHKGLPVALGGQSARQEQVRQGTDVRGIKTWTTAVYDHETSNHVQRVMCLADATARQLALSEEEIHRLRLAAMLHDIGKVGIPAQILRKPEPLTREELSMIRCHPELGRRFLELAGGIFQQVAGVVGTHHERWDGYGYPGGIATDAIPLHARILAIVDAYDAMTSQRVYHPHPDTVAQACIELQRCAGSQFDPRVVKAFLGMLERYPALAFSRSVKHCTYQAERNRSRICAK